MKKTKAVFRSESNFISLLSSTRLYFLGIRNTKMEKRKFRLQGRRKHFEREEEQIFCRVLYYMDLDSREIK